MGGHASPLVGPRAIASDENSQKRRAPCQKGERKSLSEANTDSLPVN